MSYLGKFSEKELELLKRRLLDPLIDDQLQINITYVSPLKTLDENDDLIQGIVFTYSDTKKKKEKDEVAKIISWQRQSLPIIIM